MGGTMDKIRLAVAEAIGTFTLIFVGVGAIHAVAGDKSGGALLAVAVAHGRGHEPRAHLWLRPGRQHVDRPLRLLGWASPWRRLGRSGVRVPISSGFRTRSAGSGMSQWWKVARWAGGRGRTRRSAPTN